MPLRQVFHGADSDIDWLQRDLGLYVVNMFDTGQAARVLNHSRFSLAHLMEHYCDIITDKQYQLADWRIRYAPHRGAGTVRGINTLYVKYNSCMFCS